MRPVRVVSYNVRYFGHGTRGLASTGASMKRIAGALASLDPLADIICLQEVETTSLRSTLAHRNKNGSNGKNGEETQLTRLMAMLHDALRAAGKRDAYEAYYFPAHSYRVSATPIYTTGLAVIAHRDFHVSHHNAGQPHDITYRRIHPVKRLKQTRICAHLRVHHASGVDLDVFNTHLSLPTTLSREFWLEPKRMGWGPNQVEEAKNVVRFVENEKRNENWFLVGDFNALPGSPVYRTLLEAGYADAFACHYHFCEDDLTKWPTAGFMNMRMHLDHVFSGSRLRWLDFDGTHRFGQKNGVFRGLSDHVPIVGSFTFD
jgi:endonuclease/exonuclease/phosphatase family metal-dependent hydrolase